MTTVLERRPHASPHSELTKASSALAILLGEIGELVARGLRLAAMPEDRLGQIAGAAVMQKERVAADGLGEADAPERRRAPFAARRLALGPIVGKTFAHVVQQQIGVGPDQLMGEMRLAWHIAGHEFRRVAGRAADLVEHLLALQHFGSSGSRRAGTARFCE